MTTVGQAGAHGRYSGPSGDHRRRCCGRWATRQASSARTISATSTSSYRPCTGSTSSSGYLYHLDAMEDPFWHTYPPALKDRVGPRNLVHSYATTTDDPTDQPRWGKIGKQRIVDEGPLPPHPMTGHQVQHGNLRRGHPRFGISFIHRAKQANKPFFVWMNPTRMHVYTHLSPKYQAMVTPENDWYTEEAGHGADGRRRRCVLQHLKDIGVDNNTIVVFTTDNGAEVFTWPDGGMTPFAGSKGMGLEGGFRSPAMIRWPGHVAPPRSRTGSSAATIGSRPWSTPPVTRTSRTSY